MVKGPGVVIGRSGSIGGGQWIADDFWPLNTTLWAKDFRGNCRRWVYYVLKSLDFSRFNVGSGVPTLNRNHLSHVMVPVPLYSEQLAIAEVLGALDDKIETNHHVAQLADDMWFTIASKLLNDPLSIAGTAPLSSLAMFTNGGAFTKGATGAGRMVLRIAELNNGPSPSTVYHERDVPEGQLAHPGSLLFAWSGSLTVARWFRAEAIINQHIFKVTAVAGVPQWLVHAYLLRLLSGFRDIASDKATTMGHIQRQHLEVAVPIPDRVALAKVDGACASLWQRALAAERETVALEKLRDALLPALLSGRVSVHAAEDGLGGAV